jgi:hypothetical protein
MKNVATLTLAAALSAALLGCAIGRSGSDFDDPAARETAARVLGKQVVRATVRPAGPSVPRIWVPVTTASDATVFLSATALPTPRPGAEIDVYEYRVKTADGRSLVIYSERFEFAAGACVKLLESSRASYPRIERAAAEACGRVGA